MNPICSGSAIQNPPPPKPTICTTPATTRSVIFHNRGTSDFERLQPYSTISGYLEGRLTPRSGEPTYLLPLSTQPRSVSCLGKKKASRLCHFLVSYPLIFLVSPLLAIFNT